MRDRGSPTRVGILGGTLDPIHVGHIETARAARRALDLSAILVMPARTPPHRAHGPAASMFHRFAMASLAVQDLDAWTVCDDELRAEGPSYTAMTLERLARNGLAAAETYFITGADAFAEIETWYRYPDVLDLAHFIVISRPGIAATSLAGRLPQLRERVRPAGASGTTAAGATVYLVDAATPDVSSTGIRARRRAGESITGLVPAAVETHILRHRLYTDDSNGEHD
jgi:nicotinate-nucleotide adenylyltransferase